MAVKDLRNKAVLVTGAGAGIGRSTALAFAKAGSRLAVSDIDGAALDSLEAEIIALGTTCASFRVDVSDYAAMKQFALDVYGEMGPLDVLVNNAGIGFMGPFLESSLDHWPRVLGVNIMGTVYGCHLFIPRMLQSAGSRHVVIVASAAANYPPPSVAAYTTSKFGIFGFAEALKLELMHTNVGVTTVCPGVINTSIVKGKPESLRPALRSNRVRGCVHITNATALHRISSRRISSKRYGAVPTS